MKHYKDISECKNIHKCKDADIEKVKSKTYVPDFPLFVVSITHEEVNLIMVGPHGSRIPLWENVDVYIVTDAGLILSEILVYDIKNINSAREKFPDLYTQAILSFPNENEYLKWKLAN